MSKRIFLSLLVLFLAIGFVYAADPVEGYWKSIDEKTGEVTAFWKIYVIGNGSLRGEIIKVPNKPDTEIANKTKESYPEFPVTGVVNKMRVIGTPWIFNLIMKVPGQWEKGKIIDPGDGKMYSCRMVYHAADGKKFKKDTLEMRGEIGLGIGKSQFWERATDSEVK